MAFMGLIMIMFRSSYLEDDEGDVEKSLYDNSPKYYPSSPIVASAHPAPSPYEEKYGPNAHTSPAYTQGHGPSSYW